MVIIAVKKSEREYYFNAFNQCTNDMKRNWNDERVRGENIEQKHDRKTCRYDSIFISENA